MRVCDSAKELMTTSKELLQLLQAHGSSARSPQTNITAEHEQYLREEIKRMYYSGSESAPSEPAPDAPAVEAPVADAPAPEAPAEEAPVETPAE